MKTVKKLGFQGDVAFLKVDALPEGAAPEKTKGPVVVAHSETGHHHVVEGRLVKLFRVDAMTCYLRLDAPAEVVHQRPFDTHETLKLGKGVWQVRRQREWTPEGWRRVED